MPGLNPGCALMSLVPESRTQRIYLLMTLINTYGIGLILTAMTVYAIKVVHLTAQNSGLALTIAQAGHGGPAATPPEHPAPA